MHPRTVEAGDWWARSRGAQATNWIENYQRSLKARHRGVISQIVGTLQPTAVLEVGCHCGPNLVRLATDHPTLRCAGIDANAEAIAAGQQWVASQMLADRVELHLGRLPAATAEVPSGSIDVVLSCYTLAYMAPPDLDEALAELGRIARRAVILAEPHADESVAGKQSMSGYTEWHHNYASAIQWASTMRTRRVTRFAVDPPVDALREILVLES